MEINDAIKFLENFDKNTCTIREAQTFREIINLLKKVKKYYFVDKYCGNCKYSEPEPDHFEFGGYCLFDKNNPVRIELMEEQYCWNWELEE